MPLTNSDATFFAQIIGIGAIGGFVCASSLVVWLLLKFTIGLRPTLEEVIQPEIGLEAYPEFGACSQRI